ncbi:MAG: DUF2007 domain-containing protein [Verrucomicrobia bacterium]|nr:DUF2007 domain-containing protein [Verrucomicrobiota bacterium]
MEPVTVFRSFNQIEAQLVRSRLEAAEFDVFVIHELTSLIFEAYTRACGGILVQVPEDQAVEAREFLESAGGENP